MLDRLCLPRHLALAAAGVLMAAGHARPADGLVVQGSEAAVSASVSGAFGQWGNNAAAIAVAPNWVLTTRHQDLPSTPNRTVTFGGQDYTAIAGGAAGTDVVNLSSDLRLVRIEDADGNDANLGTTLQAYTGPPLTAGTAVTLGGFGPGIGEAGVDGFNYLGNENNNNPLRFGTNVFDGFSTIDDAGSRFDGLEVLVADFDPPGTATASEATGGPGDSGGAWLVENNGVLQIAGLTHGISQLLDDPATPGIDEGAATDAFFGQGVFASDATAFASIINTIPEPATLALLAAATPWLAGRRRRS